MEVICQNCSQNFEIAQADNKYYREIHLPAPTWCPDCRQQRRLAWRNERTLYKRKCDGTGEEIISVFHNDAPFPVYKNDYWYSDKWDPLEYGGDFDFNRPFFEQVKELIHRVPQLSRSAVANQNSDFVNQCGWCKNCYLIFEADYNDNCLYASNIYDSRFSMDCLTVTNLELCYECIDCQGCYNLRYCQDCQNCSDSWFLKSCMGCRNCYGCVNLRNKEYYFLNEKYSREDYEKKIAELKLSTPTDLENAHRKFLEFTGSYPHKYMKGVQNEDSTGNYLSYTQRAKDCYDCDHMQDCRFVYNSRYMQKCYDITVFGSKKGAEYCYEVHETGDASRNIIFSDQVWTGCYDIAYSKMCVQNCHHLFGCVGMKHQNYCILNKKYEPEEYESLKNRIVEHMKQTGEWGQFFPASISPFAYNETVAQYYYPLNKEQALGNGFKWRDPDPKKYQKQSYEIPVSIKDVPESIVNEILACKDCSKNYKIADSELKLLKKFELPVPIKCPDCRHKERFKLRNPRRLWKRSCDKCDTLIQTTYDPSERGPAA